MSNPVRVAAEILGLYPQTEDIDQVPYYFKNTIVLFGSPLTPITGLDSVRCRPLNPKAFYYPSIGGGGAFASNNNTSGEIELQFLQGAFSIAHIELFDATGIAMPLIITDISSGGTGMVIGSACRVVDIGEWERGEEAPIVIIRMIANRMIIKHGLRVPKIHKY
jgi:hypothetical protein